MTPDVYAALHAAGAWLAANWRGLAAYGAVVAVLTAVAWALWPRDDYRSRNDRRVARLTAALEPRPEPGEPGSNDQLLAECQAICPELARKEES